MPNGLNKNPLPPPQHQCKITSLSELLGKFNSIFLYVK
jgi:hypothetical protein